MFAAPLCLALGLTVTQAGSDLTVPTGLPAPQSRAKWVGAVADLLARPDRPQNRRSEAAAMLQSTLTGKMGLHQGWFHPGNSRLGWKWLADRRDADGDGRITPEEFDGPADVFSRLDRDEDGALTADDFDWWSKKALAKKAGKKDKGKKDQPKKAGSRPSLPTLLAGMFTDEIGSPYEGPRVGTPAPRFTLPTHDGKSIVSLEEHLGGKPVVLIFGSFT